MAPSNTQILSVFWIFSQKLPLHLPPVGIAFDFNIILWHLQRNNQATF